MSITPAQAEALARVTRLFDHANSANIARWGEALRGGVSVVTAASSAAPDWVARDVRTLHALHEAGLIVLASSTERYESLRRGSYGRWIGGTKAQTWIAFTARPTPAGREELRRRERGARAPVEAARQPPPKSNNATAAALERLRDLPDAADAPGDVDLPTWLPYHRSARFPPGNLSRGEWAPYFVGRAEVPIDSLRVWQYTVGRDGVAWQIQHRGKPVTVVRQRDGRLTMADGHHRVMAALLRGETTVLADEYLLPKA